MDTTACVFLALLEALLMWHYNLEYSLTGSFFLLIVAQYLAVKFYRMFLYPKYFSPLRHLPGPKDNHFLFGQALNLLKAETPTTLYIKWMREHPDAHLIRFLTFGNGEVVVCNSLESFKEVLQTKCYSFRKSDFFLRLTKELVGHGIVTMEGEAHKTHRRMITPIFSINNIRKLEQVLQTKSKAVISMLGQAISSGHGSTGKIDCTDVFSRATLDIIGVALLGVDVSALETKHSRQQMGSRALGAQKGEGDMFHDSYEAVFGQGALGMTLMFLNVFIPVRWIPLETNRRYLSSTKWIENFLTRLVRQRLRTIRTADAEKTYIRGRARDLLTLIVEESLPGGEAEDITEEEIVGDLLQLMIAGHETSANVISWAAYVMATRHDIQDKLRKEMGKSLDDVAEPSFSQIDSMPYLDNFLMETLRVYASATTTHRQARTNEMICGTFIPKDTTFDIVPHVTLMSPKIWGDDVDEFDPGRWDRLGKEAQSPYAFSTFSNGPRVCLGRPLAFREMKIIIVDMIRAYRFLEVDGPFTVENPSLTLRPHGMKVVIARI